MYRTYFSKIYTSLSDGLVHWSDATGRFGTMTQDLYCIGYFGELLPARRSN